MSHRKWRRFKRLFTEVRCQPVEAIIRRVTPALPYFIMLIALCLGPLRPQPNLYSPQSEELKMSTVRRTHEDYQIGIICALALEKAAIEAMLDEEHLRLERKEHDVNDYTLGRIGVHNIAIACLPAGLLGNGPAAVIAKDMERSFPIKFGLLVGISGGV